MLVLFVLGLFCCVRNVAMEASSNYFCAEMNPQHHVIIDQIMGMWFGVEIIYHQDEVFHVRNELSCPIIHISEEREHTSTYNPLYRNYNYNSNYGPAHGYGADSPYNSPYRPGYGVSQRPQTTSPFPRSTQQEIRRRIYEQQEYDRQTTYGNYPATRRQYYHEMNRMGIEMKYLRLIWDENGESTEYHMRYNISKAGFWISSGPENGGASLDPQYSHFAGIIQVLKAVGNHMVLTFCHQLPDRQLYSVVLSRELKMDPVEIHGVHNMLNRRGLRTNNIKKVCNNSGSINKLSIKVIFGVAILVILLKI